MEGHNKGMFQGDQLVPTQGLGARLREDAESPGREHCLVNPKIFPVELMIIMVIFNMFMTKEAEGAGLCGVWGAGSVEHCIAGVCSPAQMAESLGPPCLPVPVGRQEWPLCG